MSKTAKPMKTGFKGLKPLPKGKLHNEVLAANLRYVANKIARKKKPLAEGGFCERDGRCALGEMLHLVGVPDEKLRDKGYFSSLDYESVDLFLRFFNNIDTRRVVGENDSCTDRMRNKVISQLLRDMAEELVV